MPLTTTPNTTSLFLVLFILAFFPSLFIGILTFPFTLLGFGSALLPWSQPELSAPPNITTVAMSWTQKQFTLPSKSRGSYLITDTVMKEVPEIKNYKVGLLHLFVQHTSCALSLNENWDEDVRYVVRSFLRYPCLSWKNKILDWIKSVANISPERTCPTLSTASLLRTARATSTVIPPKVLTICPPTSRAL